MRQQDAAPARGPELPPIGRILAIDPGEKRIGLALSDPSQILAQPLATLTRRRGKRFPLGDLRLHVERHAPVGILIGLPLAPDGSEDARASAAREAGELIGTKSGLPVAFWDERMSTARIHSAVRESGGRGPDRKEDIDRLAATVLLQTFLDSRRS
jgi:putative Holliday junction resolvase